MSDIQLWTLVFIFLSFTVYIGIAWRSRVKETAGFYVAGQGIPTVANGAAVAADWMSAASFISMAGLIAFLGYDGAIYLMGWTGGYVLLALLLAPYLRKWGEEQGQQHGPAGPAHQVDGGVAGEERAQPGHRDEPRGGE
ncbi:MAG: hypothetical protein R6U94_04285, partial [Nitriliruptoraceae bacterium]